MAVIDRAQTPRFTGSHLIASSVVSVVIVAASRGHVFKCRGSQDNARPAVSNYLAQTEQEVEFFVGVVL